MDSECMWENWCEAGAAGSAVRRRYVWAWPCVDPMMRRAKWSTQGHPNTKLRSKQGGGPCGSRMAWRVCWWTFHWPWRKMGMVTAAPVEMCRWSMVHAWLIRTRMCVQAG